MTTHFYKITKSLGEYRATLSTAVENNDFYGEIINKGFDNYKNGEFEGLIYSKGELLDIKINGWSFSHHIKGDYHLPGSYNETNFTIEAQDPEGTKVVLSNIKTDITFSENQALCLYLEMINLFSNFKNADSAKSFCNLSHYIKGSRIFSNEEILSLILSLKNCLSNIESEKADEIILKEIQDTLNKSVDRFAKSLK